jgi:hypothetical protein
MARTKAHPTALSHTSVRNLLLSLGLVSGSIAACGNGDGNGTHSQASADTPVTGCGDDVPCPDPALPSESFERPGENCGNALPGPHVCSTDAGSVDAAPTDAGTIDAAPTDAGSDASSCGASDDAASPDAGVDGFGLLCVNAPLCAPDCPPPDGILCTDSGVVYVGNGPLYPEPR